MLEKRNFYINGAWVAPAAANDFAVIDPSTEEQCAVISLGDQSDTDAAVNAARAAFDSWSQTSKEERTALIQKLAEIYDARQEEMAQAMSMEMGAPILLSRQQQVGAGSWHIVGPSEDAVGNVFCVHRSIKPMHIAHFEPHCFMHAARPEQAQAVYYSGGKLVQHQIATAVSAKRCFTLARLGSKARVRATIRSASCAVNFACSATVGSQSAASSVRYVSGPRRMK